MEWLTGITILFSVLLGRLIRRDIRYFVFSNKKTANSESVNQDVDSIAVSTSPPSLLATEYHSSAQSLQHFRSRYEMKR